MAIHRTHQVQGAPDIEHGSPRTLAVGYSVFLPDGHGDEDLLDGLVFFIPGFGQDNDQGYIKSFCGWVADTFGLACVSVDYHAHGCRPGNGATRQFTQPDADRLVKACLQYGAAVKNGDGPAVLLDELHKACQARVASGQASGMLTLTCGLVAHGGERQNFGLMQALDHLHVLHDLKGKIRFDRRNVLAIGSSHGGYLAQLLAKLAPNTLRAVFDNAGYATAPMRYINGRAVNLPDMIETYSPVMQMYFFLESMWSLDAQSPNYFHEDARQIRSLMEPSHVHAMAGAGSRRTRYRCLHGPGDQIAPTEEKAHCCAMLSDAGFDMDYRCAGPGDVDGVYIKSLEHGLGLSLRGFFERSYVSLPESDLAGQAGDWPGDDFDRSTELVYAGSSRTYHFAYGPGGIRATMS